MASTVIKSCVITGAGRGIGRAVAVRLSRAGFNVLAAARNQRELQETVSHCPEGRCIAQVADVSKPADIKALIARCSNEFGRLDALINNAGIAPLASIEQMDEATFAGLTAVNVHAVFVACQAAWPALRESKGTIINVSSLAALDPFPGFTAYGASKAWVNAFTRGLADEGREVGVKVFCVGPGAVETPLLRSAFPDFPPEQCLQPDDVAATIEMLLDERCQYATGQTMYVRR